MPNDVLAALAIVGWALVWFLLVRDRRRQEHVAELLALADQAVAQAAALAEGVYRVHLSCPWCDWTEVIVRESRDAALDAGNLRIAQHNTEMGHQVKSDRAPRTGYYKGEPLN